MKLTNNFNLLEFACNDGTPVPDNLLCNVQELAENLQVLRDYFGIPIIVNSGYRHEEYNRNVGGAKNSQHLLAKAADIVIAGNTPKNVKDAIEKLIKQGKMKNGGVGLYSRFVHYDCRNTPARW